MTPDEFDAIGAKVSHEQLRAFAHGVIDHHTDGTCEVCAESADHGEDGGCWIARLEAEHLRPAERATDAVADRHTRADVVAARVRDRIADDLRMAADEAEVMGNHEKAAILREAILWCVYIVPRDEL